VPDIQIETIYGLCPVQAEGTINGKLFYFRSRGEHWEISISTTDPLGACEWSYRTRYGDWPSAGWITEDEAREFIENAAVMFANGAPSMERGW
jgi:hypothetical protein